MWTNEFLVEIASKRQLTEEQKAVFMEKLRGSDRSDIQIAAELHISSDAVRNRWSGIYQKFGIEGKGTGKYGRLLDLLAREHEKFKASSAEEVPDNSLKATTSKPDPNFVGREKAIANLDNLVRQGAKIILIHAKGGVGKTTLARKYLQQEFGSYIEFPIAKEPQNITSVESLIEERLKQLGEEPGREFGVSLDRLKRKLETERIGVLIDNLEPALDGNGKIIDPHRRYVELLRVLANPEVQSVTLITSRERLYESAITVQPYPLEGLELVAWQEFFNSRQIHISSAGGDVTRDQGESSALIAMHKAYGGNAKAMEILSSVIFQDYDGNIEACWQEIQQDLLIIGELEDLVTYQFNRLQKLNPDAYKLLSRMGCYRYQDVPTVPEEGLFCMLWDVPAAQHRRVVKSLRDRSLVEFFNGQYWLHPVIRAEAITRLRASEDCDTANHKAAEFWTDTVKTIETIEDAIKAFEAYYYYIEIQDFELAGKVLEKERNNRWRWDEPLGISFYRLGLSRQIIVAIDKILKNINPSYLLSRLHNVMGDSYWISGYIYKAIEHHKEAKRIAEVVLASNNQSLPSKFLYKLINIQLVSLFNIGLCKIDLGELQEGINIFEEFTSLIEVSECRNRYMILSCYCLAFLNSCLGLKKISLDWIEKGGNEIFRPELSAWGQGYSLLFLGLTYKNLREIQNAFNLYYRAISFAEESHYTQVKAKALNGLAELYREQEDFNTALSHHSEAIELLDKIGAKCDLAEAYYQLGLTYRKIGKSQKSQGNFDKAIQLFSEMEAPKQVEKVRQAMES